MVLEDLKPRDILTTEAFANAAMVILSVSGSINTIKHLQAVAEEAQCEVDVYRLFERYADEIPLLTAVRPNGDHLIEEFEAAGGALAVMKQLESFLYKGAKTVTGRTVGDILQDAMVVDEEVIRPVDRPLARRPSIVVIRGSLAPGGAIVKLAVADDRPLQFRGPAKVYDSPEEAIEGLKRGDVREGQVLVLRGLGPKGTPGMGMASNVVFAVDGVGLSGKIAVVTDGQQSGLSNKGLVVGEVSPEAAEGGPLALVEDGDLIAIDVEKKCVNLEVPEDVLEQRRARLRLDSRTDERGWLSIYRRLVTPLPKGATLLES
jgi:dihydroxy-acid dehydratase